MTIPRLGPSLALVTFFISSCGAGQRSETILPITEAKAVLALYTEDLGLLSLGEGRGPSPRQCDSGYYQLSKYSPHRTECSPNPCCCALGSAPPTSIFRTRSRTRSKARLVAALRTSPDVRSAKEPGVSCVAPSGREVHLLLPRGADLELVRATEPCSRVAPRESTARRARPPSSDRPPPVFTLFVRAVVGPAPRQDPDRAERLDRRPKPPDHPASATTACRRRGPAWRRWHASQTGSQPA